MANTGQSHALDMTKGSPMRLLMQFSLPLFFGNLLQQCYNLADTAIAGHLLGDAALAQIGATAALYSLIMNFAFGLNNGMALTVSRSFGAGDEKKMRQATCWMVTLAVAWDSAADGCVFRDPQTAARLAAGTGGDAGWRIAVSDSDTGRHSAHDGLQSGISDAAVCRRQYAAA